MFRVFPEGKHRSGARHNSSIMHKLGLHLTQLPAHTTLPVPYSLEGRAGGRCLPLPLSARSSTRTPTAITHHQASKIRRIPTARLRVRYLLLALTRRSADRWLPQLACPGTCGAPPATRRTRRLRVRPGALASTYCRYPPIPSLATNATNRRHLGLLHTTACRICTTC